MTTKIFQNDPDRGSREFELVDDSIEYRISSPFGEEELSVVLSVLSPEPVIDGEMLYFVSEVNREALIKMFVDLPDAKTFAGFVRTIQQRIREEDFGNLAAGNRKSAITREQVDTTIRMLETHLDATSIDFNNLGVQQGAVLTYASFFTTLLSNTDLDDWS